MNKLNKNHQSSIVRYNKRTLLKRMQKKFHLPVIGHFADKSVRFNSILEAEKYTGINYQLIFEACIGKIRNTKGVYWEYENGAHYIKYKSFYKKAMEQILAKKNKT